jgi:type III pantothenate kinase
MQLVIDIGNSSLKFGLFDKGQMTMHGTGIEAMQNELEPAAKSISRCMISSVADHDAVAQLLKKLNIPYSVLAADTQLPIQNLYQSPQTLGADRITLAVAGSSIWGDAPALVIGAGTCITYNFIDQDGYHGGAISPGITMRFQALHHYTSRLPEVDWSEYKHERYDVITGTDSRGSILTGVLRGVLNEIDGTIDEYKRRYSGLRVAVTGGDMDFLVKNLKNDIFARPDMVLEGLNYILMHNA